MFAKKYLKVFIIVGLLGLVVVWFTYGSYRGNAPWPLHTEETAVLQKEIKDAGLGKVKISYRTPQTIEIECKSEQWEEKDVQKLLDDIKNLLLDENFQTSYAQKYTERYDSEIQESYPEAVTLKFMEKSNNLPAAEYMAMSPAYEWYQP